MSLTWERQFTRLMTRAAGPNAAPAVSALPPGYTLLTPPSLAVRDLLRLNGLSPERPLAADLWQERGQADRGTQRLQVYSLTRLNLDELMPYLQNLHLRVLDQLGFTLPVQGQTGHLRSFVIAPPDPKIDLHKLKGLLLNALTALLNGAVENDPLNTLVTLAALPWQDIDLFRAYRNYYFQWNPRCTPERFRQALQGNPAVVSLLFRYFDARFRPDPLLPTPASREEEALPAIRQELAFALNTVADSGSDRILRDLFNLIDATLRTNHYLRRDQPERFLALKMDSMGIFAMPSPKPRYEIYIHSPTMEGVHLRGSKVARGGIRWSDRLDDFREEILDLMQTQMIKNALIVPHGAKGGFIVKSRSASRRDALQQAKSAYKTLIRGLLDLTDNRSGEGNTSRHPAVLAYDDEDPYLVVAADKGTSHFSDVANAISAEYGFWLGDAFASGGSHGYDHKQLGITARGAWECVKRHFAEMGRDPETQPMTVVGIGSMEGDVFGNGLLLSRRIRLLGAFGSRHIFLDPDPDPERSYEERLRLFRLDGCNWTDYDGALISPGGGVFSRDARNIPLSPRLRNWLGIRRHAVDGEELVRLLLTAPVDLLWLGGIGTYVKASTETHDEVGDRGNDGIRVDACQLRAKVVGEGANLGFTQQGRVEYALAGGRINTDAVDNSGGVDLSDHEVNLKIFMAQMEPAVVTAGERDRWLAEIKDEVCASVLAHNSGQSLCISLDVERCRIDIEPFLDTADELARSGFLDRRSAFFPSRKELIAREGRLLTRPDLAILMPCSKLAVKQALLEQESFIQPWTRDPLFFGYFPAAIRERFAASLSTHSLAREIAATQIANWIIDRAGSSFPAWNGRLETEALLRTVSAYLTFDRAFGFENLRNKIRHAPAGLPVEDRYRLLIALEEVIVLVYSWVRKRPLAMTPDPDFVGRWRSGLQDYLQCRADVTSPSQQSTLQQMLRLDDGEARLLASLHELSDFPAIMETSELSGTPVTHAASLYSRLARELGIDRLLSQLQSPAQGDHWERRARAAAAFRLRRNLMMLSARCIAASPGGADGIKLLTDRNADAERFKTRCRELLASGIVTIYGICAISMEFEELVDDGRHT